MAVRSEVISRLAPVLHTSPATLDRGTASLAAAGYTRKARPGGGIGAVHYDLYEIRNVLLGSSAHVPSEAADAVAALEGLVSREPNALSSFRSDIPAGIKFGVWLAAEIERWASPTPEMLASLNDEDGSGSSSLVVSMSPGRRHAHVGQWYANGNSSLTTFMPERGLFPHEPWTARRTLEITERVLLVAGELLADTLARQVSLPLSKPKPASGGNEGDVPETETTKATGPASRGDLDAEPSASRAYPALVLTASLQEQSATKEGSKQSLPEAVGRGARVRQPVTVRTRHHGANWSATSPA